jgi:hypothetical protein
MSEFYFIFSKQPSAAVKREKNQVVGKNYY